MKTRLFAFALLLLLFRAATVAGQSAPFSGDSFDSFAAQQPTRETIDREQVYEDIEVMRRLLQRGLQHSYGAPGFKLSTDTDRDQLTLLPWARVLADGRGGPPGAAMRTRDPHAALILPAPEGVYLKGKGIIYTVTLPAPKTDPVKGAGASESRSPSDWDRTRRELRGEKVSEPKKQAGQPALADVVLQVLADNGKHLHLAPEETVTVAITLRGAALTCSSCHRDSFGEEETSRTEPYSPVTSYAKRSFYQPVTSYVAVGEGYRAVTSYQLSESYEPVTSYVQHPPSVGQLGQGPNAEPPPPEQPGEMQNLISVGDLHYRQGNYGQALKSYGQAIEVQQKVLSGRGPSEKWTFDKARMLLMLSELHGKQARVQLGLKDAAAARRSMQRAADLAKEADQISGRTPVKATPGALPAKLIVTVSKKSLDLVGNEMVRYDDFRKSASVEYLTFSK